MYLYTMLFIFLLVLIGIIFHTWFTFIPISSGDLGFFFKEHIVEYFNSPFMWETFRNAGLGGKAFLHQGVYFYNIPLGLLGRYFDYGVIERIIWFYPILLVGFIAPIILGKVLNIFPSKFYPVASFVYILNTYFFMTMGGGQLTVVQGYITIPLALSVFITAIEKTSITKILLFCFIFAFLFAFDFRYAYIFLVILLVYTVFLCLNCSSRVELIILGKKYIVLFLSSFIITIGIHAFWLLPYTFYFHSPVIGLSSANTSENAVQYFSFAQFENSIALLHPYWPENIFGKVGFMRAEFLVLPILAYGSLFFINSKLKAQSAKQQFKAQKFNNNLTPSNPANAVKQFASSTILFFAFLGLLGAFLAKGANPPFGDLYIWMFEHIPGFIMFREPTKWYTLVALSYSVLIPFSIWKIYELLKAKLKRQNSKVQFKIQKFIPNAFLIFAIVYLLFLIHPAIFGKLGGTLKPVTVPQEYIEFKNFLVQDKNFFRVLWIPTTHRFTFYSDTHPAIGAKDFFGTYERYGALSALQEPNAEVLLRNSAVKYIVLPNDTQKEIFFHGRDYRPEDYRVTEAALEKIPWLRKTKTFGKIIVFEIDKPRDHFWSPRKSISISYTYSNPTEYIVSVRDARQNDQLVFSERFDKNWQLEVEGFVKTSTVYDNLFNSFYLPKDGDYTFRVVYQPQKWVYTGLIISIVTVVFTMFILLLYKIKFHFFRKK